jgi:hypothetical protein
MPQNSFRKQHFLNSTSEQQRIKTPLTASCVKEFETFYISHLLLLLLLFMIHYHTHIADHIFL